MAKPFSRLRFMLAENDIDNKFLADRLGKQPRYVSDRMTGKRSWTIEEAVLICDLCHIPLAKLPEYFCQAELDARQQTPGKPAAVVPYRRGA